MARAKYLEENSGYYFREKPTASSDAIQIAGASSVQEAIQIASGAYVTKVAIEALALVTASSGSESAYLQVGDGDSTGRYITNLQTLATNDIAVAPSIQTATDNAYFPAVRTDCVGAHKYTAADTIDVKTTGSVSNTGSVKIHCWYYTD